MTHKQRTLAATNHKEPDRVPICVLYTPEAEKNLLAHLGLDTSQTETYKSSGGILPLEMDHDFLITWIGPCSGYYAQETPEYSDEWGIGWKWFKNPSGGSYTEIVYHPLAGDDDLSRLRIPDFADNRRYEGSREMIVKYGDEYAIMGGVACTLFELAWYLRGLENLMMDMLTNKDYANELLDRLMTWILVAGKKLIELGVDIIWVGDDAGMQDRMLIRPELWREFLKPRYARMFSEFKNTNPDIKIAFHSDGYIEPIIPDFIEIGLDILNPIQPKSMDPARLKKLYGDKLTFWGCVDIQEVLPFGTPEDVEREVKLRIETVGKVGGLLLAPAHNIQPDVKIENILAFYRAARRHGRYKLI